MYLDHFLRNRLLRHIDDRTYSLETAIFFSFHLHFRRSATKISRKEK